MTSDEAAKGVLPASGVLDDLTARGLIADCTDRRGLEELLARPATLYAGFDPSADSLHVGNLVPLVALRRFQRAGHTPLAVAGGATGLIGDPSGRTSERQLLTRELLDHNLAKIKQQLRALLDFDTPVNPARLLDNADWTTSVTYLNFLREVGKYFSVNVMIGKESVRARMEDRDEGLSYTEFSYMLLQAFDFYHLSRDFNCLLQIGGSDQWGNITAGIDLIRKKAQKQAFALTLPLITNSDGTKFGKSVEGAVWLDPAKTSVYRFYQFWVRTDDRDVIKFLKYFTFLDLAEIEQLAVDHAVKPEERGAHRVLAREMTGMVHGPSALADALRASEVLFGGKLDGLSEAAFQELARDLSSSQLPRTRFADPGCPLVELVCHSGLAPSKGQARKDVEGGGIYLNNQRMANPQTLVTSDQLLFGKYLLLRKGKRNYAVVAAI